MHCALACIYIRYQGQVSAPVVNNFGMKQLQFAAVLFGLGWVSVDAFVAQTCGSNEMLMTSPPACESTCYQSCASVPSGVYDPTCVCLPRFVRSNGECIPEASCPVGVAIDMSQPGSFGSSPQQSGGPAGMLASMFGSGSPGVMKQLASEVAAILMSGDSGEMPSAEIPTTGRPVAAVAPASSGTKKPPFRLNPAALKPNCKYSGVCPINQVQVRKKICCEPTCYDDCTGDACTFTNNTIPNCVCLPGYVRHMGHCIHPKYCPQGCTTPAPPEPCILETTPCDIEEFPTEPPCEPVTTPAPCPTTPPPCPTTKPPCPTTPPPTPCPTTPPPTPCPTTKPPCPTTKPPCPTTKPPCPTTLPPCPTTPPPCATTPAPCGGAATTARPCPPNSTYSSCTPCCEPTCTNDCRAVRCISPCSGEPTCVCNRDYVKQNGRCIPRIFCPNAGSGGMFGR